MTQPGKIAVVYNQPKVEEEYRRYFNYLASRKIITGAVEALELEELPGATGLKALRIEINHTPSLTGKDDLLKDLKEVLSLH